MPVKLDDKPVLSSRMYRSYSPSEILPIHPSNFMSINGHNVCGKRQFFEMLAGRKIFHVPTDIDQLYQKTEYELPSLWSNDQGPHISVYDSTGENFVSFTQSTTDTGGQSASRYTVILPELYANGFGGRNS
ncbi:hypothetical protein LOAG_06697 [Loa loa]|uniref:Uncharacterized protein n=1 Tax=Loa loa TaxID=7209 RepID=A0A1S0TZ36_LOALO|nr:hypothetical protein LOAG_06697 [Loa loa]EFO21793.2 hypothetical protein LOAG_06697 [Loa loa]